MAHTILPTILRYTYAFFIFLLYVCHFLLLVLFPVHIDCSI
jgi:hypothetical protein